MKPTSKMPNPMAKVSHTNAWRSNLSASHRGPRPGKQTVQKAPKAPSWKVRF